MSNDDSFQGTQVLAGALPFDRHQLLAWLHATLQPTQPLQGPLRIEQFKGGQSNPTYLIKTDNVQWVMRTKPAAASQLLPSAHAIEREFKVMRALQDTAVPVARMLAMCEDESVIGRAFYLMSFVPGRVFWAPELPGLVPAQRTQVFQSMNQVLADLHLVNLESVGLSDYGRAGNYFERQIARWSKQYLTSITEPIAEMDQLMQWLPLNMPELARDNRVSLVHGDYRLDNLIFDEETLQARAVLDWELSTLGNPLADFTYFMMQWVMPGTERSGLADLDLPSLGIPSLEEVVALYCRETKRPGLPAADWYFAYNLFRLGAICQGIVGRVRDGTANSPQATSMAARVQPLGDNAWKFALKAGA